MVNQSLGQDRGENALKTYIGPAECRPQVRSSLIAPQGARAPCGDGVNPSD